LDTLARSPELDSWIRPLSEGLAELPKVVATDQGAARLRNGNPGMVIAHDLEYGDEAWATYQGQPIAIGQYKAGELHPSRVFNFC
jgi:tRNA pseudouridine55 synthase